jgi:hypothetical protein
VKTPPGEAHRLIPPSWPAPKLVSVKEPRVKAPPDTQNMQHPVHWSHEIRPPQKEPRLSAPPLEAPPRAREPTRKVPPQMAPCMKAPPVKAHLSAQLVQDPDMGVQGQMIGQVVCWNTNTCPKAPPENDEHTRQTTEELVVVSEGASGHDGTQSQVLSRVPVTFQFRVWPWSTVPVPCVPNINHPLAGKMGLENLCVSIYVSRESDVARPPQILHGLPNQKLMETIPMHRCITSTNRLMSHPDTIHDGRSIIAQRAFMDTDVRTRSRNVHGPEKMFTLIPWMEILNVICMWVAAGRYRTACCYLEFECVHGRHRSLGAAFLVACFLKLMGAKVTLFHYGHRRLCWCCGQAQFGWRWAELAPIACWIGRNMGDRTNPDRAWHIIAATIDQW